MPAEWPDGFAAGERNRRAALALTAVRSMAPRRLRAFAMLHGSAQACVAAVARGEAGDAAATEIRGLDVAPLAARLAECGARIVLPGDDEYLPGLTDGVDPPVALFVRGRHLGELLPGVAVVGARNCSALGRDVATRFGEGLAGAGVTVVSGGARGIDAASHEGALAAGTTVAVLGSGIDVPYPQRNRRLLERIAAAGAVVSEYPPGTPATPYHFPARNRLIVALARAIVIVEGAAGSGTLITCGHAMDLGRTVFAVPGPVTGPLSAVPHELIREGATLVRGVEDVLADLGIVGEPAQLATLNLSEEEEAVLANVHGPTLAEHIAREIGAPVAAVAGVLMRLELRGAVRAVGGRYERTAGA